MGLWLGSWPFVQGALRGTLLVLDTPSRLATEACRALLMDFRRRILNLDPLRDRGSVEGIARVLLRATFEGACHCPEYPENDGWVELFSFPALTEALGPDPKLGYRWPVGCRSCVGGR